MYPARSIRFFIEKEDLRLQNFPFFVFILQRKKKCDNIHIYLRILNKYLHRGYREFPIFIKRIGSSFLIILILYRPYWKGGMESNFIGLVS